MAKRVLNKRHRREIGQESDSSRWSPPPAGTEQGANAKIYQPFYGRYHDQVQITCVDYSNGRYWGFLRLFIYLPYFFLFFFHVFVIGKTDSLRSNDALWTSLHSLFLDDIKFTQVPFFELDVFLKQPVKSIIQLFSFPQFLFMLWNLLLSRLWFNLIHLKHKFYFYFSQSETRIFKSSLD